VARFPPAQTYQLKAQGYDLERLAYRVAGLFEITPDGITSSGKHRQAVKARGVF